LRAPAQSLEEYRVDVVLDRLFVPLVIAILLTVMFAQDLWRLYHPFPPMPWLSGTFAFLALTYGAWNVWRTAPHIRNLRLAIVGEKTVGQGLEQLRQDGYAVYHDIPGDGFNVDHVLVGPAGIFTIETKTWSKPVSVKASVVVDGDSIVVDGRIPSRDPIPQARGQAAWISKNLKKSTGRDFPVIPVIVFPGWWVETNARPSGLWVINDKALPKFLANEKPRLRSEDIFMAKTHLEAFIRLQDQRGSKIKPLK
jgi:hypothetical protein